MPSLPYNSIPRGALQPVRHLVVGMNLGGCFHLHRREAGVLDAHGQLVPLVADDLHVGHLAPIGITPAAPDARDRVGVRRVAQHHAGQIELVNRVRGVPAGEVPIAIPIAVHLGGIRPFWRRAEPLVPIEPLRRRGLGHCRLRIAAIDRGQHIAHFHVVDFAELAVLDVLAGGHRIRTAAVLRSGLNDPSVLAGGLDHPAAFLHVPGNALLHVHVLARLNGPDRGQGMPVFRRRDLHRVEILPVQHFAEIVYHFGRLPLVLAGYRRGNGFRPPSLHVGHPRNPAIAARSKAVARE